MLVLYKARLRSVHLSPVRSHRAVSKNWDKCSTISEKKIWESSGQMLIVFKMLQLTELILQLTQASRRACTCRVTSNLQISELFCLQPSTCTGTRYGMLWNKPTCTYSAFDSLRSVPASLNSKIEKGSMSADVQSPSSHPVYHHWQSQDFQSRLPLVTISSLVY